MISLICGIQKTKQNKASLRDTKNRLAYLKLMKGRKNKGRKEF